MALPVVVASSVVRSAQQGESHGGVYLVDLEAGTSHQCVDWNDPSIDWSGRGADRGLRGIAIHGDRVLLAATDQVLEYDPSFRLVRTHRNPYLAHCHEVSLDGDLLWVTSTGYDAILALDLRRDEFVRAHHLSWTRFGRERRRRLRDHGDRPKPRLSSFDPRQDDGPSAGDTCHVNNVHAHQGRVFLSGTGMGHVLEVVGPTRLRSEARIPYGTHNARPLWRGVVYNHTVDDAVIRREGRRRTSYPVPQHDRTVLQHTDLPGDHARPSFGRGLCIVGDVLIAGSSPATITAYDLATGTVLRSVTLTTDVRNAIHGLEHWPFGMPAATGP